MKSIGVKEKINNKLVEKYVFTNDLGHVLKNFKNPKNYFGRNKIQVNMINSGLKDLKEKITNMSGEEKKSKSQIK